MTKPNGDYSSGRFLVAILLFVAGALPVLLPLVGVIAWLFGLAGVQADGLAFGLGLVLYLAGVRKLAADPRIRWRCPIWPSDR